MRKTLRFIALAFFSNLTTNVYCQWQLTGNALSTTNFLGSTNSEALRFRTANTEKMRLNTNGFLGLGIATAPASMLHINNADFTEVYGHITNSSTGTTATDGFRLGVDMEGIVEIRQQEALPMYFYTSALNRMTISTTGLVGIGITAPTSLLHLKSTATGDLFRTAGPAASENAWRMITGTTERGKIFVAANGTDFNIQAGTGGSLLLRTGTVQRLRVQNLSGWVLIGQNPNAPSSLLHIDGVTDLSTPVGEVFRTNGPDSQENIWRLFTTNASAVSTEKFQVNIPANTKDVVLQSSQTDPDPAIGASMIFKTGGANERMRITQEGAIGIGTTVPGSPVHINGRNNTTDALYFDPDTIDPNPLLINHSSALLTENISSNNPSTTGVAIGIIANAKGSGDLIRTIGQQVNSVNNSTYNGSEATGISAFTTGGDFKNTGLLLRTTAKINNCDLYNYGVENYTNGQAARNVGGYFEAIDGSENIGIWAKSGTNNTLCTSTYNLSFAGIFEGNVLITGSTVSSPSNPSDSKLKKDVVSIENADSLLALINPVTFKFKKDEFPAMNFDDNLHYGFIAQEVEAVMPELVKETALPSLRDKDNNITREAIGFKTLSYEAFIPLLVRGYQQQQRTIETLDSLTGQKDSVLTALQNTLDSLAVTNAAMEANVNALMDKMAAIENCLNNLPSGMGCSSARKGEVNTGSDAAFAGVPATIKEVELSNRNNIVLNQNSPNPFREQTTIAYFIPENVGYAQIVFTDNLGRIIKTVDISEQGHGQLNVFANDLSSGIYTYSIMVDGAAVDTKKMVRTK